ncbi:hypothetical protein DL96DRAFT_1070196 [Flagelloscypha sp. PMI_526]|nr:hypothetical protein DL96DRAFT_1070196 [Flagelloscypha sp. PMI_526]
MHPTLVRAVRIVERKAAGTISPKQIQTLERQDVHLNKPSLIDILLQKKKDAGEDWPSNIRIEKPLYARHFGRVRPELKLRLKTLTQEK